MKRLLVFAAFAPLLLAAGPAAARNYDCSKPGNANKAVCKGKTAAATPAKVTTPAKTTAPAKPVATAAKTTRNYDCSKAGNKNKAACKGATPAVAAAPAAKPAAAPAAKPVTAPASKPAVARGPVAAGAATGKCKDGTETHATNHRGACSRHGGVASWY